MKTAFLVVLICFAAWRTAKRRDELNAWASAKIATLIRGAMPTRWPEVGR